MVGPAANSLLAAQIYGSVAQQGSARVDASARRAEFEDAAKEARALGNAKSTSRSFPVDRIELASAPDGEDEAPSAHEVPEAPDAQRFAREAPGTSISRNIAPGSRLDIRV